MATARSDQPDGSARELLAQLLQSVEQWRHEPRLVVVATTNDLDALDPAITRAGRFDRHVRLDLPDEKGRLAVLEAALDGRPVRADLDLTVTARHTAGQTPAARAGGRARGAARDARGGGHKQGRTDLGGSPRRCHRAARRQGPSDRRRVVVGPARARRARARGAAQDAGAARGSGAVRAPRDRSALRPAAHRPARHGQDDDRQGARRRGEVLVLSRDRGRSHEPLGG